MATRTTSASTVSAAPPFAGSILAFRRLPDESMAATFEDSLNVIPCFSSSLCACRRTSPSMPGRMPSRNSTTVTCAPSRRHTDPSSRPITPAPTTSRCLGTSGSTNAPVEDTIRFSSISMPFKRATSEPVATTMDFASSDCVLPSAPLTSTLPAAAIRPLPWKASTLFFFRRNSTPFTLPSTPWSLKAIMAFRSSLGAGMPIPILLNVWPASSKSSDACRSAFDGMQPMFRQVPPNVAFFSTTAVFRPSCAARMAQT